MVVVHEMPRQQGRDKQSLGDGADCKGRSIIFKLALGKVLSPRNDQLIVSDCPQSQTSRLIKQCAPEKVVVALQEIPEREAESTVSFEVKHVLHRSKKSVLTV
jgi:hypothetical protein